MQIMEDASVLHPVTMYLVLPSFTLRPIPSGSRTRDRKAPLRFATVLDIKSKSTAHAMSSTDS
jgi:hypothetical protein